MSEGFLVDYYYCTGCHTCEMACATSHNLPIDKAGVKLHHEGAYEVDGDVWQDDWFPFFTERCDLCRNGEAAHDGEMMCVHHCQSQCIRYGEINDLVKEMPKSPHVLLYAMSTN